MPWGGARPGAGQPPTNLRQTVGYRETEDGQVPVSVMDRVEETLRYGGFMHDAAARVGVPVETLRGWRRTGNAAIADVMDGRRRRSELTAHERQCCELAARMDRADAEARIALTGVGMRVAQGGWKRREVTTRTVAGQPPEVTVKEIEAAPDGHMIGWLLSHRWPEDFGRTRVEVTGAGGGPVGVDVGPIADRLREAIDGIRRNTAASPNGHEPAGAASNGHGANGNGHAESP